MFDFPYLQIAKIRSGHGFSAMKGPYKPYRHLEFLTYTNIRSIVDFTDNEGICYLLGSFYGVYFRCY